MSDVNVVLILCTALGSGLMADVFFAFSTFVMRALARLQPAHVIRAMQEINRTVINPWFLGAFLGTAACCLVLGIAALWTWPRPDAVYVGIGSALYLVGTFLVTVALNVPMNDALEVTEPDDREAADAWDDYLLRWTFWNHVRTAAALMGAAAFTLALL